jgi:hypothetical protein
MVENLRRFLGDDKRLDDITPADADDFRRWLGVTTHPVRTRKGSA